MTETLTARSQVAEGVGLGEGSGGVGLGEGVGFGRGVGLGEDSGGVGFGVGLGEGSGIGLAAWVGTSTGLGPETPPPQAARTKSARTAARVRI